MEIVVLLASLGPLTTGHHVSEQDHAPSGRTARGPISHRLHSPTACSHLHAPSQPKDHATLDQLYQPHVVFPSGQSMSFSVIAEALHLRRDVTRDFLLRQVPYMMFRSVTRGTGGVDVYIYLTHM
jgi:hypothetical protein